MQLIVTTAGRPDDVTTAYAQYAANALAVRFVVRKKRSVARLQREYGCAVLVAGKARYEYFALGATEPLFFHPNTAAFRVKRLARGETETLLEATKITPGDTVLDCTLGLGADALVMQFAGAHVTGLEANAAIAFVVREGMQHYDYQDAPLLACMRDIKVVASEALAYLRTQPNKCFDVVYLDPMFDGLIAESTNFSALREAGEHTALTQDWVDEAKRVARKRVVLKAHFRSPYFAQFGFIPHIRETSKFHFGEIVVY